METLNLTFTTGGEPTEEGWYLVKLKPEIEWLEAGEQHAVDRYEDGLWLQWDVDDITHYAKLP